MKRKWWLVCVLTLTLASYAGAEEVQIELIDLYGVMPLNDTEEREDWRPPHSFSAIQNGHLLTVNRSNSSAVTMLVTNTQTGTTVVNTTFTGTTAEELPAGTYMLELYTEDEALGGMFEVE